MERGAPSTLCRLGAGGRAGKEQVSPGLHAVRAQWGKHVPPTWTPRSRHSSPSPQARPPGGTSSACWGPMGEAGGPRAGPGNRVGLAVASSVDAYESHGVWSTEQRVDPCFSGSCCVDSPTHRDLFVTPNNTPVLSQSLGDAWRVNALISPLGSLRSKQATLCLLVSSLRLKTKACLTVCLVPNVCGVCW